MRRKRHRIRRALVSLLMLCFCAVLAVVTFFGVKGYQMYREAVTEDAITEKVNEIRGKEDFVSYQELPQFYIDAVIAVEDHRFESHCGIDPIAVCRAAWTDIRTMSFAEGGSTITQQLTKNLFFTQEKQLERKAAEVFAVLDIEKRYSKQEIFELYVNTIYFGSGYYGIYQASRGYFGKMPSELNDYESAMLAGIPNAPSVYSLDVNEELAGQRVKIVLGSMVKNGMLIQKEADKIGKNR